MTCLTRITTLATALVVLAPLPVRADSTCTAADRAADDRRAQRGEALERDGKPEEALPVLYSVSQSECASTATMHAARSAYRRVARTLGERAEKAGQFDKASEFFARGEHLADADRAMRKHAQANKARANALGAALGYFERRGDAAAQTEVRGLANASGDQWLQAEEKTFAGGRTSSLPDLEQARNFLRLVGAEGEQRVKARALQRGDAMAKGTSPKALEMAIDYYGFADDAAKGESIRPIARRYGDAAAQRGEHRIAEQFYALSGDQAKIEAMDKAREQAEGKRQKDFKKGQDDLEKELKM